MNKNDIDNCLNKICYFVRMYNNQNKSLIDIYHELNYKIHHYEISIEKIIDKLKVDDSIIDEWILFSSDKRCTPAWAIHKTLSGKWSVSRIETTGKPSYELIYDNRILACAHMIKFEMEDFAYQQKNEFQLTSSHNIYYRTLLV